MFFLIYYIIMEDVLGIKEEVQLNEQEETKDYDIQSSSDEDSDNDEDEIKKLENSINKDNLLVFHPEITQINYNELIKLVENDFIPTLYADNATNQSMQYDVSGSGVYRRMYILVGKKN